MTVSVPEGLRLDVNLSILFTELPLLDRPAAAKAAGFDAVEFWWPFETSTPGDAEVTRFVRAIRDAGVRLAGLNFAAGDMPAGDRGLVSLPRRSGEFRESLPIAIGIAQELGCRAFNALYGNRIDGTDPAEQDEIGAENLAIAARAAGDIGAVVLLEPVSGVAAYPLRTAADALAVLDRVQREDHGWNLRLLADLYHLTVNGDDLDAVIATHTGRIGHVQIADAPGRNEPGTGSVDLAGHLGKLAANGYSGYVGLEYQPSGASADSFGWLSQTTKELHD
ncbi:hydroxypyruvate isomerase family protein [Amycolatopsis sp. 195334CR]|uniref:hydroxypyruvate isomerase family protein n=1 Tax=Amycolatopsis sp. 195334CR TaxID=2814588 RepID=UPI001A8CD275|nr:TIM barrel protein [Amycolatopsis sp. 195334CR]MBN6041861.1 TIM barrel protein [Amycolatopsis sp. 195334CR]